MKIAIYGKPVQSTLNEELPQMIASMQSKGFRVAIYERFAAYMRSKGWLNEGVEEFNRQNLRIRDFAFLVSVGGDGTLLDTVTLVGDSEVPVIGINTGRLGFISSATIEEMGAVCDAALANNLCYEERSLLELVTKRNHFHPYNFALNELTVLKKDTATMIRIDVSIDNELLNSYWADGLIVSTPTGSTAYSLSCGGPIVMPDSDSFVVTPIAPHNLNVRPVVVSSSRKITIKVAGRSDAFLLALDSRPAEIKPDELLEICRTSFNIRILQPPNHSFIGTLRNKLAWGYDKRN